MNAVVDGSFQASIRQAAATRGVDALTIANVIANSYQLLRSESQLNEPVIISNPEGVQSCAGLVSTVASLALVVLPLLLAV